MAHSKSITRRTGKRSSKKSKLVERRRRTRSASPKRVNARSSTKSSSRKSSRRSSRRSSRKSSNKKRTSRSINVLLTNQNNETVSTKMAKMSLSTVKDISRLKMPTTLTGQLRLVANLQRCKFALNCNDLREGIKAYQRLSSADKITFDRFMAALKCLERHTGCDDLSDTIDHAVIPPQFTSKNMYVLGVRSHVQGRSVMYCWDDVSSMLDNDVDPDIMRYIDLVYIPKDSKFVTNGDGFIVEYPTENVKCVETDAFNLNNRWCTISKFD